MFVVCREGVYIELPDDIGRVFADTVSVRAGRYGDNEVEAEIGAFPHSLTFAF